MYSAVIDITGDEAVFLYNRNTPQVVYDLTDDVDLNVTRGIKIKPIPLELILSGRKIWEIRGQKSSKREKIGLIESGTSILKGFATMIDCIKIRDLDHLNRNIDKVGKSTIFAELPYKTTYAYVLKDIEVLDGNTIVPHNQGAIVWHKL